MPENDITLLTDAALEAGRIARGFWRDDPQVWDKGGDDPVSEADFAVDSYLKETLIAARPDYGWVSEETDDDPRRLRAERIFVVDPIDGTRSFVAGEKTWAHSLAIVERGIPVAACVYLPVREKLYLATRGGGATLNGAPISASNRADLPGASLLSPRVTFQDRFWKSGPPEVDRHFRPSLAYRLALVAEGRFDGMLTLRPSWEWDIAAGALLAEEGGAAVTDRKGKTLTFNSPSRQTAGVIATAPKLLSPIVAALAD